MCGWQWLGLIVVSPAASVCSVGQVLPEHGGGQGVAVGSPLRGGDIGERSLTTVSRRVRTERGEALERRPTRQEAAVMDEMLWES